MDKLTEYLQTLLSSSSSELHLEPNKNPYLLSSNGTNEVATTPILGPQISTMIFPLIPAELKMQLPNKSEVEFVYSDNLGNFNFQVKKSPAGFNVTIRPSVLNETPIVTEQEEVKYNEPVSEAEAQAYKSLSEQVESQPAPADYYEMIPDGVNNPALDAGVQESTLADYFENSYKTENGVPEYEVEDEAPAQEMQSQADPNETAEDTQEVEAAPETLEEIQAADSEEEQENLFAIPKPVEFASEIAKESEESAFEYQSDAADTGFAFTPSLPTEDEVSEVAKTEEPQAELTGTGFELQQSEVSVEDESHEIHVSQEEIEAEHEQMAKEFAMEDSKQEVVEYNTVVKPENMEELPQNMETHVANTRSFEAAPVAAFVPAQVDLQAQSKMNELFEKMAQAGASDLHMSVSMPPMIRKDGKMQALPASGLVLDADSMRDLLHSIMPAKNKEEFAQRNDTDFAYEIPGLARFRANIFRDRKGMGGVFRIIPSKILTSEQLGLSNAIMDLCNLSKGLVVVTGPTGSGKSTTLCAMVDSINRNREDHIITIEDPIEFVHENKQCLVNQREVHNHTDSFKDALRAALREDPDILLVGEMRDLETISIAIETAETGHLVFGTLHTTTAASTIDRIIDQFPADRQQQIRVMLSESLRGVISQTLLPKVGGGRVAALEVLIVTPAISNLIREGKTFQIPSAMQTGKATGMVMLNDALIDLVKAGTVEAKDAYIKAVDKKGFEMLLSRNGLRM